jgi:hypothetical protein
MARPKGSPNKATADVRKAIAKLAELNVPRLNRWIAKVAEEDPGRAAEIVLRAIEYHIPKLGRTEVTGQDGGPVEVVEIVRETA